MRFVRLLPVSLLVCLCSCLNTSLDEGCKAYPDLCHVAVSGIEPSAGPVAGISVTISGHGFDRGSRVTFGTIEAPIAARNDESITVSAPAQAAGTVDVVVTNANGTAPSPVKFRYVDAPTITTVTPDEGPRTGGYDIEIDGAHLSGATVKIGGHPVTVTSASDATLSVTVPAVAPGPNEVVIESAGGTARSTFSGRSWTVLSAGWTEADAVSMASSAAGDVYLSAEGGKLYRTSTVESEWTKVHELKTSVAWHEIAVSPTDPNAGLLVGVDGIWRTSDGFATVTRVGTSASYQVAFARDGQTAIAGGFGGIQISHDGGWTWTTIPQGEDVYRVAAAADSAGVLAALSTTRLFVSTDSGATWEGRMLPAPGCSAVQVSASRVVVGDGRGIDMTTTVRGAPFSHCDDYGVNSLATDSSDPDKAWLAAGVTVSSLTVTNSCAALSKPPSPPLGNVQAVTSVENLLFVGMDTIPAVFDGTSWTRRAANLESPTVTTVAVGYVGSDRTLFGLSNAGQVYRWMKGASAWTAYGPATPKTVIRLFASPESGAFRLVGIGADNSVMTLAPGGTAWSASTGVTGAVLDAAQVVDANGTTGKLYLATAYGLVSSVDGGQSFTAEPDAPSGVMFSFLSADASAVYGITVDGQLFGLAAGTTVWSPYAPLPVSDVGVRGLVRTANGLLASSGNDGLFRFDELTHTWSALGTQGAADKLAVDPHNPSVVYATVNGLLQRSDDSGTTWHMLDDGSVDLRERQAIVDPVDGTVFLTGVGGLVSSLPGGP